MDRSDPCAADQIDYQPLTEPLRCRYCGRLIDQLVLGVYVTLHFEDKRIAGFPAHSVCRNEIVKIMSSPKMNNVQRARALIDLYGLGGFAYRNQIMTF